MGRHAWSSSVLLLAACSGSVSTGAGRASGGTAGAALDGGTAGGGGRESTDASIGPAGEGGGSGRGGSAGGAGGTVAQDVCVPGPELCNGLDDDCDGQIDEPGTPPSGIDYLDPAHCGSCTQDCSATALFAHAARCEPSTASSDASPPTCSYDHCAPDRWDLDGDRRNGCEYYCPYDPNGDVTTDLAVTGCGKDDDCDGKIDEDLDLCHDADNCGSCGISCQGPRVASAHCEPPPSSDCTLARCVIDACDAGWTTLPGAIGCGVRTGVAPAGPEICDGYDNDGDGFWDESGPPPDGVDGTVDPADSSRRIGDACGSDVGECRQGRLGCSYGAVLCIGAAGPTPEICDGLDNDCDGTADDPPDAASSDPPVCNPGSTCVTLPSGTAFECAPLCGSGEFPCPTGMVCTTVVLAGYGSHLVTGPACLEKTRL